VLRVQLCSHAFQASLKLSFARPGRSFQEAKSHLLFGLRKLEALEKGALGAGAASTGGSGLCGGGVGGREPQATKKRGRHKNMRPKMDESRSVCMGLILLEALLALVLLVLIVWWTMFSGRKKGELVTKEEDKSSKQKDGKGS
jgi:hypothetical protein